MIVELLLLLLGLGLLLGGGETLVRGSTGLARSLGVSPLVIGLTVVAFGTSAPELAVNLIAAWRDRPGISFGNVMGSNMANIGLIVGCAALIRPILIHGVVVRRELPMMLLATAAAAVMAQDLVLGVAPAQFARSDGVLLLLFFLVFLYYTVGEFARRRPPNAEAQVASPSPADSMHRHVLLTLGGLAALVGGAHLTVEAAVDVARMLGISEVVIGLTLLAIGTSLPELAASVVATLRGHAELAIGNVVGSNIFNLLLVLGLTATMRPIPVPAGGNADILLVGGLSLLLMAVSLTQERRIVRTEAALLLVSYVVYIVWRSGNAAG